MTLRLGAFSNEGLFQRMNQLLLTAESLDNWNHETAIRDGDYGNFWSLMWQLQVAEYFVHLGAKVSWLASGPDLRVLLNGRESFVECYVYRKAFQHICFLQDLLFAVDHRINVDYNLCLPLGLSDYELDELVAPLTQPNALADFEERAAEQYPVVVGRSKSGSVTVWFSGDNTDKYQPNVVSSSLGDPEQYLRVAYGEMVKAKDGQTNKLRDHRPNTVFVNALLSKDFQLAGSMRNLNALSQMPLPDGVDCVVVAVLGVDETLTEEKLVRTNRH